MLFFSFLFLQFRRFQRSQREKDINLMETLPRELRVVKTDKSMERKLNFYFRVIIIQCESFPLGKIDGQFIDLMSELMILIS